MSKEITLDIGCGQGSSTLNYPTVRGPLIGLDLDLKTLRENLHVQSGKLIPVCAEATHLPFANNLFSSIYVTHVLEHLPPGQEQEALNETQRVSSSEGTITIAVPHPRFESVMGKLIENYHSPDMHQQVITSELLTTSLNQAGFNDFHLETRKWFVALGLTSKAILHRLLPQKMQFTSQVGFKKNRPESISGKLNTLAKKISHRIERLPLITPILNRVYPFETYVQITNIKTKKID